MSFVSRWDHIHIANDSSVDRVELLKNLTEIREGTA